MDASEKRLVELVDVLKSWMPWRSEPAHIKKDFWMPDHSCRVCYECDSQFTIINRRHHCRHCGRVFCAKCTSNSVPASSDESRGALECDRIRVCNYCFERWEQEKKVIDNGISISSPTLSPSPSATSLASTKSSITGNSSIGTGCSMPYSTGPNQHSPCEPCVSPGQSTTMVNNPEDQDDPMTGRNEKSNECEQEPSSDQFSFCVNRSDDEEDDFSICQSDSERRDFDQHIRYYDQVQYSDHGNDHESHEVQSSLDNTDNKDSCSVVHEELNCQESTVLEKYVGDAKNHYSEENVNAASSIYGADSSESEPVDFENNGLLWLPPDPEDEDDDREPLSFDDDDEEDAPGEWKSLRSSGSFGKGEYRCKDRSGDEHRQAMKNVVEGHFRALVAQLLQVENLPAGEEEDNESWLDIITFLSWEAATLLKPDMSKGGGMDPGGYVKVKCIACGQRRDSKVVKGVVCKKNVAHRRMTANIQNPRFLVLGGALEYQRVSNLLSSFDTLLQQEMDHLKMAVAKIDAHHPNVLLVEKTVSRYAQEYLLAKNISLVLNIKRPLLERIARCTGAQIVPSIDHLSSQKLGSCGVFRVEKLVEDHGSAGQGGKKLVKNLMFFEECPKPLGCTILLQGASGDELKKVKHVVQYGIFAAYHLALETSFLADEGASLPELPLQSPITVALPEKASSIDRSISTIPGFTVLPSSQPISRVSSRNSFRDLPEQSRDKIEEMVVPKGSNVLNFDTSSRTGATSTSSSKPKNVSSENGDTSLKMGVDNTFLCNVEDVTSFEEKNKFDMGDQNMMYRQPGYYVDGFGVHTATLVANEGTDSEHQLATLDRNRHHQEDKDVLPQIEEFPPSPSDHQSILVSLSTRCVWKGTVCERAHLFRIKYYGSFDKPLGRFLRDHLFDQSFRCHSCDMPTEAHVHCYTHRQGSLTISVKKLPELLLPGQRDGKIWMWHRCLKCPRTNGFPPATRRIVMSDAAWGLSFGKFLELSFSNHAAASRVASCGHSLHRDCLRFYGFGNMVACFRYASIDVHSVYLPPSKLDFNYQPQEWVRKEADEVVLKAEFFFSEVLNALNNISERNKERSFDALHNMDLVETPESRYRTINLEKLLQKEKREFEEYLQEVLNRESRKGQPILDILEINKLRRLLIFYSYMWDCRLIYAASFANGSREDLNHSFFKQKEKPTPLEKLAVMSTSLKTRSFTSGDVLLEQKSCDPRVVLSPVGFKPGVDEFDINKSKETIVQTGSVETGGPVRRTLSEGQFPVLASLSDTLDAAWTGDTTPARPQENGLIPVSTPPISKASIRIKFVVPPAEAEHLSDAEVEAAPTADAGVPDESACVNDLEETSFLSFYCSYENFLRSNPQTLESLAEYNPVYVSSFRDLGRYGGAKPFLPLGVNDTVVPVYDDEPTSIIAYVLVSPEYHSQLSGEREKLSSFDSFHSLPSVISGGFHHGHSFDETSNESLKSFGSIDDSVSSMSSRSSLAVDPLFDTKALHTRVSFSDPGPSGKIKYSVTCFYAKRFEALRKITCPSELDFIRSLSRCKKWGAQGGKSNVFFAKTLDDRFIIKQVTKTELESFIKFAPEYFKYLSESIGSGSPTCLAKILGIYQVTSKHVKGGKESRMDVLVMENLLFGRNVVRLYDLKGSSRSRYNADSSGTNKVLLDQNLIESMPTSPIFVGNKAKRVLERAVWNDTSFLATIDVMDYSLLVGVDEEKHELVLGIIDFMRQYTWDKHLETWVKASGILGGTKNSSPTVISPKQYKKRFRKAMSAYFLMVPDQWLPPTIIPSMSQLDLNEDNQSSSQE